MPRHRRACTPYLPVHTCTARVSAALSASAQHSARQHAQRVVHPKVPFHRPHELATVRVSTALMPAQHTRRDKRPSRLVSVPFRACPAHTGERVPAGAALAPCLARVLGALVDLFRRRVRMGLGTKTCRVDCRSSVESRLQLARVELRVKRDGRSPPRQCKKEISVI